MTPTISPLGDRCVTIRVGEGISLDLSERVVRHARAVRSSAIRGVTDVVASYASLGVFYEPLEISFADLTRQLELVLADADHGAADQQGEGKLVEIKVSYDGEDLEDVCRRTRLRTEDVVEIHSGRDYRVFVVGFVPGFAYLGPLDPRLEVPRRESPRKRVPAGSVAIAEAQTGIYPTETPGGWNLIGTTQQKLFDPSADSPSLLSVGDLVRFVAAS
ncbi:MAG: 5-oxoprolinase subunit PxpB [Gemmatimonadaceae bacterium]